MGPTFYGSKVTSASAGDQIIGRRRGGSTFVRAPPRRRVSSADQHDPFWTETCWFTFTVPERRLSGQLYPFFRPNQGVVSAGAYFWDPTGHTPADILHARHFWHLPIPDEPLSDIHLPNGIAYRCLEPLTRYELSYDDPDTAAGQSEGSAIRVRLTFTAIAPPNYLGETHLDQPGRYVGTIVMAGEEIAVDAFGFRDR